MLTHLHAHSLHRRLPGRAILGVAMCALALAACASDDASDDATDEPSAASTTQAATSDATDATDATDAPDATEAPALLVDMQENGAVLGIMDSPPTTFADADGAPQGYSSDIAVEILSRLGVTDFETQTTDFAGLIPSLQSKRVDISIAGLGINDERCPLMKFSPPTHVLTYHFAVLPGNPDQLESLADIGDKGVKLALEGATTQERVALEVLGEDPLVIISDRQSGVDALTTERVAAYVAPLQVLKELQENNPGELDIVEQPVPDLPYLSLAHAINNDDADFAELYNATFQDLLDEGFVEDLSDEYGYEYSLLVDLEQASCAE